MFGLLIKDFPPELHSKLKEEAARHHRSMTRQALALLEQALSVPARRNETKAVRVVVETQPSRLKVFSCH